MLKPGIHLRTRGFILFFFLLLSALVSAQETIRIGVLAYRGEYESTYSWTPTINYLNKELAPYQFELVVLPFEKLEAAVKTKRVDLLICNPANFILFREKYGLSAIATMQKYYQGKVYTEYGSLIFTLRNNTSINTINDLKGTTVAVVDRISMGGCMLPQEVYIRHGIDLLEDSKTIIYTHNHEEVISLVLTGQADMGIVRTGIVEDLENQDNLDPTLLKVIHKQQHPNFPFLVSTDLIPEWPLAKMPHFSEKKTLEIVRKLYTLNERNTAVKENSGFGWTIPQDYSSVKAKLQLIKAPPYNKPGIKESFENDWQYFFLMFALVVVLSLFILFSRYVYQQLGNKGNASKEYSFFQRFTWSEHSFFERGNYFENLFAQKKYELPFFGSFAYLKWFILITIAYYFSVYLSLVFSIDKSGVTAIWFAAGIGFVSVYALGYRIWPAIFLGALLSSYGLITSPPSNTDFWLQFYKSILDAANNTFEALIGVFLVRKITNNKSLFSTIRSTVSFIIIISFLVSLISAIIGASIFSFFHNEWNGFYDMLLTWWLSDAVGLLLVVPLVLSWRNIFEYAFNFRTTLLFIIFIGLLSFIAFFIFQVGYHIAYLFIPFFIYFSFRFGRFLSLAMTLALSLISIWFVVHLHMYWLWNTPEEGLFYVRLFIIILLLTILLVSGVLSEQEEAEGRMRLYKEIVQNSNEAIAIIDPQGYYLEQNPAHEKLIGYTDQELIGQTPAMHLGKEAFGRIAVDLKNKNLSVGEWISHTKKGDVPIDISAFSVFNESQKLVCYVGIKRDISERKKAENILRQSEAEAWSLYEHAAIPIMIQDFSSIKSYIDKLVAAGLKDWDAYFEQNPKEISRLIDMMKVIGVNKQMVAFFGKKSEKHLLSDIKKFFTPESLAIFQKEVIALARGQYTFTSEFPIKNMKGEIIYLILSFSIPPAYRNTYERVLISFVDISENKRNEKIQQIVLNISNAANKAKDIEETIETVQKELGTIIDTSNFFLALYDAIHDEISLPFYRDEHDFPDKRPAGKTLTSHIIHNKKSLLVNQKEIEQMRKNDEIESLSALPKIWLGVPLKIKGEVIGAFVVQSYTNPHAYTEKDKETLEIIANQIALSIERKRAEEEIIFALEKVQESDRIKSAFLSSMSHELRTPLNAIIGFSNLIDGNLSQEQTFEFAQMIHQSGSNLLQIVDGIFEVSLISSGSQKVQLSNLSFGNLMNDIYQTILTRQKVLNKTTLAIQMNHLEKPPTNLYTDGEKFKHIFLHLLSNALKFTHQGTIQFGLEKTKPEGICYFYVEDTGIGIEPEKLPFIFDRFRMGDDTHTREYEGIGIGLFICKNLIQLMGGKIEVYSKVNKGSRFSFFLPMQKNEYYKI